MKKQLFSLALAATLTVSAVSFAAPLSIAKQGMFSAGGITITSPGTFDPYNQWETSGAGQTAHVDHANVFYQIPQKQTKAPIVFTHSQGGRAGWLTAKYTKNIAAIVAIEPGNAPKAGSEEYVAMAEQHIPVAFYFGDYIHNGDPKLAATKIWQSKLQECEDFTASYNKAGAKSVVFDLPKEGIYGNDHFMFQNLNNAVIAKHIEKWLFSIK